MDQIDVTQFTQMFINAGSLSLDRALSRSPVIGHDEHFVKVLNLVGRQRIGQQN